MWSSCRLIFALCTLFAATLVFASDARPMPVPGPIRFIAPTPGQNSVVTTGTLSVRLDAACTLDTGTLVVALNGNPIPQAQFLPFSACSNGRMTSQTASASVSQPNGSITGGATALNAGDMEIYSGTGTGDGLSWNFDGGAAPATGSPVVATFKAAGNFVVRMRATDSQSLSASAFDMGNAVMDERDFDTGDPSPDSLQVAVAMPPDIDFRNYESAHVHPLAMSADGSQLYAVNTPENRLSIFDITGTGSLSFAGDVPVGLGPVSLAVRPGTDEVWVVNHLSDSVNIVDAAAKKLLATIEVGDEPTDIVFASGRAFVSLAGNEDRVNVYNAATRAEVASIDIFGDDPRALAASSDGTEVYAVVLESGNGTTELFHELVIAGGGPPAPDPPRSPTGCPGGGCGAAPDVGLIVKFNPVTSKWEDETGTDWSNFVDLTLPDQDLFIIDADAPTPSVTGDISRVGTILLDVSVRPGTGEVWVANTDARNLVRFEPNLRGHLVETRISKVNTGTGGVSHVDINPHINFAVTPGPPGEIADSLSQPGDGVFNTAGTVYYLTAFGSGKVGVLDGTTGAVTGRISVGGGPSGVALNEGADRLYVMNRFENTISTVNTGTNSEIDVIGVAGPSEFDPSPDVIKIGRKFLYDGQLTSGHGDIACATCHVSGNFDNIAWDLGAPGGEHVEYFTEADWVTFGPLLGPSTDGFDPMKGPMTTQTLRGLQNLEPFHWRGDKENFQAFNGAFVVLMGRDSQLSPTDMDAYTDFIMTVNFPPNPFRNPDDSMPGSITVPLQSGGGGTASGNPQAGETLFTDDLLDAGVFTCNQCHALPTGTTTNLFNGQAEGETQDFKIPQLRNMYEKIGFDVIRPGVLGGNAGNIGLTPQKAGFGFLHDGSVSLTEFLAAGIFTMNAQEERDIFAFMLAFPTESPPCVGSQISVDQFNKNNGGVITTINTLINQAQMGKCDLVVHGVIAGTKKGYVYDSAAGTLTPDTISEIPPTEVALRTAIGSGDVFTYTGVPPGSGVRLGIDRDRDTWRDGSERILGTDPADPNSNLWQWTN